MHVVTVINVAAVDVGLAASDLHGMDAGLEEARVHLMNFLLL
jgi:hypothetical protein